MQQKTEKKNCRCTFYVVYFSFQEGKKEHFVFVNKLDAVFVRAMLNETESINPHVDNLWSYYPVAYGGGYGRDVGQCVRQTGSQPPEADYSTHNNPQSNTGTQGGIDLHKNRQRGEKGSDSTF